MKTVKTIGILLAFAAACFAAPSSDVKGASFIFPGSRLVERGVACPLDQMKQSFGSTNTEDVAAKLGALISDARKELADPFVSERLPFVRFEATEPGQKIADFFTQVLKTAGWTEGRGILGVEFTNCGGDWLRVFARGKQQVLVHVCGTMERTKDETADTVVVRMITLRFRGMKPEDLLGQEFGKKDRSQ
ncbi:MAG: hypothetical protein HYV36_05210 [Lentisphaerae bacterium]|nr:hypothetical protein [Lentisphaerota bacterium]